MNTAMNGKNFERQLLCASIRLRTLQQNFSRTEIAEFIADLPELGDEQQLLKARSVLRKYRNERGEFEFQAQLDGLKFA